MRNFITEISLDDFNSIHTEEDLKHLTLPTCLAYSISEEGYTSKDIGWKVNPLKIEGVDHIYSTRDYWEVTTNKDPDSRLKIPKKETAAIYLIKEDD